MNNSICTLLVIDSTIINAIGIRAIFNNVLNLEVLSAYNIHEATPILITRKINLIFLEINHNGVLDIKSIRKIRKIQPRVKIIIFTDSKEIEKIEDTIKYIPLCNLLKKTATKDEIINSLKR